MLACLGDLISLRSAIECQGTVSLTARQFILLLSTTFTVSYMVQDNAWWEAVLTSAGSRAGAVALSSYYNTQSQWGKIFRCSWHLSTFHFLFCIQYTFIFYLYNCTRQDSWCLWGGVESPIPMPQGRGSRIDCICWRTWCVGERRQRSWPTGDGSWPLHLNRELCQGAMGASGYLWARTAGDPHGRVSRAGAGSLVSFQPPVQRSWGHWDSTSPRDGDGVRLARTMAGQGRAVGSWIRALLWARKAPGADVGSWAVGGPPGGWAGASQGWWLVPSGLWQHDAFIQEGSLRRLLQWRGIAHTWCSRMEENRSTCILFLPLSHQVLVFTKIVVFKLGLERILVVFSFCQPHPTSLHNGTGFTQFGGERTSISLRR